MRVPWTARRSNQSILKDINPEYSLEILTLKLWPPDVKSQLTRRLMLKLKFQYFGHLMLRADSFEKTLMLERLKVGEGDDKG